MAKRARESTEMRPVACLSGGFFEASLAEDWNSVFPKVVAAGFVAVEWAPFFVKDLRKLGAALKAHGLEFIAQIHTGGNPCEFRDVGAHKKHLRELVDRAILLKPVFINSHSGHDSWSAEQTLDYLRAAASLEAEVGITICHETHRKRILWNPFIARDVYRLADAAGVKFSVNCDLSHWALVCGRFFDAPADDEWPEILAATAARAHYVHTRVGYTEGAQVPHPRAPEYAAARDAHEAWWDAIWRSQIRRGFARAYACPEFFGANYGQRVPFTNVPVADHWEIQQYMKDRELERFAKLLDVEDGGYGVD